MGTFSIWHWLILIMVAMLLFGGKGKISNLMGDLAHGIRNFKEGLKEPPDDSKEPRTIVDSTKDTAEIKRKDEVHS